MTMTLQSELETDANWNEWQAKYSQSEHRIYKNANLKKHSSLSHDNKNVESQRPYFSHDTVPLRRGKVCHWRCYSSV